MLKSYSVVWENSIDGSLLEISSGLTELTEYSINELKSFKNFFLDLMHPEDMKVIQNDLQSFSHSKNLSLRTKPFRWMTKSNKDLWFEAFFFKDFSDHDKTRIVSEIYELSNQASNFKESNKEGIDTDNFFNIALDLLCIANTDGYFLKLNPSWESILGYNIEELKNKKFLDFVHPDDLQNTLNAISSLKDNQTILNFVNRYQCKDGTYKFIEWRSFPQGDIIYAAARDITHRINIENELKTNSDQLTKIKETLEQTNKIAKVGGFELDLKKKSVIWSETIYEIHDLDKSFIPSFENTSDFIFDPNEKEQLNTHLQNAIVYAIPFAFECRIKTPKNNMKWINVVAHPVIINGVCEQITGIIQDITQQKENEITLLDAELRWQFALESSGDGLWDWDLQTNKVYFSKQWKNMLGYSDDEIAESIEAWASIIHPEDADYVFQETNKLLNNEIDMYVCEHRLKTKDNSYKWILDRGKVIERDKNNKALRVIGVHTDITERKLNEQKIKDSEEKFRTLFENMTEGVALHQLIINDQNQISDYRIIDVNPAFESHVGLKASEVIGKLVSEAYKVKEAPYLKEYAQVALSGTPYIFETYFEPLHKHFKISVISPQYLYFATVFEDITHLKETENQLRIMNQNLEEATIRANNLATQAELANASKSQFLANMSHEIRTPMNAIIGLSHILYEKIQDHHLQDYATRIKESSQNLLSILNDILDYSKIESGKLYLDNHTFNLKDKIDSISHLFDVQINNKSLYLKLSYSPDLPHFVTGDSLRLGQILTNLISNAVKFTLNGGINIAVKLYASDDLQYTIQFDVADTGIGIEESIIPTLFLPFTQADNSTTRKFGGTGLGLSITQRIIHLMQGEINVCSELNKGSVFSFLVKFDKKLIFEDISKLIANQNCKALYVTNTQDSLIDAFFNQYNIKHQFFNYKSDFALQLNEVRDFDFIVLKFVKSHKKKNNDPEIIKQIMNFLNNFSQQNEPIIPLIIITDSDVIKKTLYIQKYADYITVYNYPFQEEDLINAFLNLLKNKKIPSKQDVIVLNNEKCHQCHSLNILLAEDTMINREIGREILESYGFTVHCAENGIEVLELLENQDVDVILMDIQMPVLDGIQTTFKIRANSKYSSLPIIAMTAHAMPEDKQRCIEAGMNDYISKPFIPDELVKTIINNIDQENDNIRLPEFINSNENQVVFPENLPEINVISTLSRLNHNHSLFRNILENFNKEYATYFNQLLKEAEKLNVPKITFFLHSIKGLCLNIGANEIADICVKLEDYLVNNSNSADDLRLDSVFIDSIVQIKSKSFILKNSVNKLLDIIHSKNNSIMITNKENVSLAKNELFKLREMAKKSFFIEEIHLLSLQSLLPQNNHINSIFNQLKVSINDFNYLETLEIIDHLLNELGGNNA